MKVPGKVNLYLKVTGKRPDGYHELSTLFLPLSGPADEVTLEPGPPGIELVSDFRAEGDNLMLRAARRYAERAKLEPAWRLTLVKNIPVAAGLGGGSADAAAVLRLLNERYRALDPSALTALAAELGADVPFFLEPGAAVASGIGDRLTPLGAIPPLPLVLVNPRFPVSARWAYQALDPARIGAEGTGRLERLVAAVKRGDPAAAAAELCNDLAPALYRKFPLLRELRDFLLAEGALGSEITGSGSTIFAVASAPAAAASLAERVRGAYGDAVRVFAVSAGTA